MPAHSTIKMEITITFENGTITKNGEPASEAEIKEFEEEVLLKKISEASEEEINNAVKHLEEELTQWVRHKDAWALWKEWAEKQ